MALIVQSLNGHAYMGVHPKRHEIRVGAKFLFRPHQKQKEKKKKKGGGV